MLNRGLWTKALREAWLGTLLFGVGLFAFEVIVAAVLPMFHEDLESQFLQIEFIQHVIKALLGTDVGDSFGPLAVGSIVLGVAPMVIFKYCNQGMYDLIAFTEGSVKAIEAATKVAGL